MNRHLIIRIHIDPILGLGHLARALSIDHEWRLLGGQTTLVVSGDARARLVGQHQNPIESGVLPEEILDLGNDPEAPLPLNLEGDVVLIDQWTASKNQIIQARPRKIALMEDDGDAYEETDLLFQPYLEGIVWPDHPLRTKEGVKLKPHEDLRGKCHVLCGSQFIVTSQAARKIRPKREPQQPYNVQKLLVTFGGSDTANLAQKGFEILSQMHREHHWSGQVTLLAPQGITGTPFPGCTIHKSLPQVSERLPEYDVLWCAGGITLVDALCIGIPVVAWGQNDRQVQGLTELSQHGACFGLGEGPSADFQTIVEALIHWFGPEGQESRQDQIIAGRTLIDGLGAQRVAQGLWKLAEKP